MRYLLLQRLKEKLYFDSKDIAQLFKIKAESSWVLCNRYVKKGIFIRLKKDTYTLSENWNIWEWKNFLKVSNFLQVPSYISFMTALSFYGITTQLQRDFFESASLKRSERFRIKGVIFNFYKLKRKYYFDFVKKDDIFIATPEKAFIDALYLYSFGKYSLDFSSLDLDKLDKIRIKKMMQIYPEKTKALIKKICRI
jgi:predicted transcriptional regulator of viral defense system